MTDLPPGARREDQIVLFDGECVMCSASAQALIRADRNARFKLAPLQSPQGRRLLAWFELAADLPNTLVLCQGARLSLRSTAVVRVLWQLSAPYQLLAALLWLVPRPLRDIGYDAIARHRYRLFGRQQRCSVPAPEHRSRLWSPMTDDCVIERGLEVDESQEA